jgi:hypothetical protein
MNKLLTFISILILSTISSAGQNYEIGMGTNYGGVLGGTVNFDINESTEIFLGLGLTAGDHVGEGLGYVVGSKLWINEKTRLIANYGYNCTIQTGVNYKDYNGLNLGVGYALKGREYGGVSTGVVVDLMLIDQSKCKNAVVGSTISKFAMKISAGYRF